jgi:hypothetical protein
MKNLIIVIIIVCSVFPLPADNEQDENLDVDSLFEEPQNDAEPGEQEEEEETAGLLDDVMDSEKVELNASFHFYAGYSPGLDFLPWDWGDTEFGINDTALLKMRSDLTLNFQLSPDFRVLQTYYIRYPDFNVLVDEFFCDYTLFDFFFLRIGRQKHTWGISRNYPFTDLTARLPDDYAREISDEDPDNYSFKLNIPVGVGGVEGVVFTRNEFWEDPDYPGLSELGYGGTINIAVERLDFTIGTFYHKDLRFRSYYSLSTTLFDALEMYTEGMVALSEDEPSGDWISHFSANIGFYSNFFSGNLEINAEYFYNGESSENNIKGSVFPLFYGNNIAANISFKTFQKKINFFLQAKCTIDKDYSTLVIPGVIIDPAPYLNFLVSLPVFLGPGNEGYAKENPDELKRPMSLIAAIIIKGEW